MNLTHARVSLVCVMLQVTVDEGEGRMGWLLLRASLHDPLLVLNVESELEGGMQHGIYILAHT